MRVLLLMVALAGCIEPSLTVCDDGTACPSGKKCVASGGCADIQDVDACAGRADLDGCASSFGQGYCHGGACRPARCGDGVVDPGEVCDDGNNVNGDGCNGTCTSDESCGNGISELSEACDCGDPAHPGGPLCQGTYNGGDICRTDCSLVRCGNGKLDPGEVCDDGNNTPGDGCSFDCKSTEVCGNSITDFFAGEQCDDGKNGLLHDGCTDACRAEQAVWHLAVVAAPSGRHAHALVYDSWRKSVIVFGGTTGALFQTSNGVMHPLADTWEWDPAALHWTEHAAPGPSARFAHAMAYDSIRHRIVLFGGFTGSTPASLQTLGDTWEWDSDATTWTLRTPAHSPPARGLHAMGFDPTSGHVVMYGGATASTIGTAGCGYLPQASFTDTWEWDGTDWTQRMPATSPPAVIAGAMTYDSKRSRVVLAPGLGQGNTGLWEWNAATATWSPAPSSSTPSSYGYGLAYDPVRDQLALFGGEDWNTSGCGLDTAQSSTYTCDRTTGDWQYQSPATSPSQRSFTASVFTPTVGQTMLFGGQYLQNYEGTGEQEYNDVWNWNGTTWTAGVPPPPPQLFYATAAYDAARQQIVVFGGARDYGEDYAVAETWIWDGVTWTQRTPAQSPSPRAGAAMAYDARRERVVLFGGGDDSIGTMFGYSDTWEWDGTTWTQPALGSSPPARVGAAMAYDAAHGVMVMYGGANRIYSDGESDGLAGDTWTYDGSSWQLATTAGPAPRFQHAMAYDAARGRVVMFGGSSSVQYGGRNDFADTWEWDGTTWLQRATTGPTARDGHLLVDDPIGFGVVLVGGRASAGQSAQTLDDVWRWDGVNGAWVSLATTLGPEARFGAIGAYDGARHGIVVAFGVDTSELTDTWMLRSEATGVSAPIDDDCSGGTDLDNDGLYGCADPDCSSWCQTCGDGVCTFPRENHARCPADCGLQF